MELNDQNLKPEQPQLLDKINSTLEQLGSTAKWKRAPERIEGTDILKDKTILFVDDVSDVLQTFVPDLMVATEGKSVFMTYKGQDLKEFTEQILAVNADIILMDYHLDSDLEYGLKGSRIASFLRRNFNGVIVGFSSETAGVSKFVEAGAIGSIKKNPGNPEASIKALAELIEEQHQE